MKCLKCGTESSEAVEFCAKCGNRIAEAQQQTMKPAAKNGMSRARTVVIVVTVIVVISIVLFAALFHGLMGHGYAPMSTPDAVYEESDITNGVQVNIVSISNSEVSWNDVTVQLTDGTESVEWSPWTSDLGDGAAGLMGLLPARILGSLTVYCWVFDLGLDIHGDGYVSGRDYIQVFTAIGATNFSSATTYTLVLIYEPHGEKIGTGITFTG